MKPYTKNLLITRKKKNLRTNLHRRRIISKKKPINKLSNEKRNAVLQYCKPKLKKSAFQLLKMQLNPKSNDEYSAREKFLALTLYYSESSAYRSLINLIGLPSLPTLHQWIKDINIVPGICPDLFALLYARTLRLEETDKVCVIYMNEMTVKEGFAYHAEADKICGFTDSGGNNRGSLPANRALVLMIRGLQSNWKQPLGFIFTNKEIKSEHLKSFFFHCLQEVRKCGLQVVGVVRNQGSNFVRFFKDLNVTVDSPYFEFEESRIFVFGDVPHLLKSTRDALKEINITTSEGVAQFSFIQRCYEITREKKFKFISKITQQHIDVPPVYATKVKPAAQVLSKSMSDAISALLCFGESYLSQSASATAEFCAKINDLFDTLNSSKRLSSSHYKKGLFVGSRGWNFLEEAHLWISEWKVIHPKIGDITDSYPFIEGWLLTINATRQLLLYLRENYSWRYLLTRRLCQDGLENLLDTIKEKDDFEGSTCLQFANSFKSVCCEMLSTPVNSNSFLNDYKQVLLEFSKLHTQKNKAKSVLQKNSTLSIEEPKHSDEKTEAVPSTSSLSTISTLDANKSTVIASNTIFFRTVATDILERNGIYYVAGYLSLRVHQYHLKKHAKVINKEREKCHECTDLKIKIKPYTGDDTTYLLLKEFSPDPTIGLVRPSDKFFKYFLDCEEKFKDIFNKIYYFEDLHKTLRDELIKVEGFEFSSPNTKTFFINLFIRLRIDFILKFKNRKMTKGTPKVEK